MLSRRLTLIFRGFLKLLCWKMVIIFFKWQNLMLKENIVCYIQLSVSYMQLRKPEHKPSFFENLLSNFLPAPTRRVLSDKKIEKQKKINLSLTQEKKSKTTKKISLTNGIHLKETPSTVNHQHTNSNSQCENIQKVKDKSNRGLNFHPRKINFHNENSLKPKVKAKIVLNCSSNNNSLRNEPYNLIIDRNTRGHLNFSPCRKGDQSSIIYHTIQNIQKQTHNRSYQSFQIQQRHHSQIIKKFDLVLESTQKKCSISPLLQVKRPTQKISEFENISFFLKQQEKNSHISVGDKLQGSNAVAISQSMKQLSTGIISTNLQEPQIESENKAYLEQKLLQTPRNLKNIQEAQEIESESISSSENESEPKKIFLKKDNFRQNLYDNIQTVQSKYDGSSKKSVSDCQSHVLYRMNGNDFKNEQLISTPTKFNAFNRMTAYQEMKDQAQQIQRRKSLNTNLFLNYDDHQHLYGSQDKQLNMNFKKKKEVLLKLSPRVQEITRFNKIHNGGKNCIQDFFHKIQPSILNQSEILTNQNLNSQSDGKINSIYDKLRKVNYIGVGRFASVYLCIDPLINFIIAVKEILKFTVNYNCLQNQLIKQIQIQQSCNHPNLINLYHYWVDDKKFYLGLEYGQETLLQRLQREKYFDQRQCARTIKQIADGLHYLHLRGIVHRDIKPQNIILVNGVCKISDFGWATRISLHHLTQICGTPCYISPQIQKSEPYSFKTDCWSLGVLAYEIANGKLNEEFFTYSSLKRQELKFQKYISTQYKSMLYKLLAEEENERASISELLSLPIFTNL